MLSSTCHNRGCCKTSWEHGQFLQSHWIRQACDGTGRTHRRLRRSRLPGLEPNGPPRVVAAWGWSRWLVRFFRHVRKAVTSRFGSAGDDVAQIVTTTRVASTLVPSSIGHAPRKRRGEPCVRRLAWTMTSGAGNFGDAGSFTIHDHSEPRVPRGSRRLFGVVRAQCFGPEPEQSGFDSNPSQHRHDRRAGDERPEAAAGPHGTFGDHRPGRSGRKSARTNAARHAGGT